MNTRKITVMGMLVALSVALVWLIHFPIIPSVPFLEYDPADIPILLASCTFGILPGLALTLAASVIQGVTVSAASGIYGILMHFIATAAFVVVTSLVCRRSSSPLRVGISLACGALAMAAVMMPANLLITPIFMGTSREAVFGMLPMILLFNLAKAGINAVITFLLYPLFRRLAEKK